MKNPEYCMHQKVTSSAQHRLATLHLWIDISTPRNGLALVARSAGRLFVLSQAHQQFSEAFLARARSTSLGSLAAHIHQLGDSVPAGATRNGVLSALQELVGFLSCLGNTLLLLVVVVLIEVVDVLLSLLDRLFSLSSELLGALSNLVVSTFTPLLNNLGFLLLLGRGLVS
jgi:hypothetical protein